MATDLVTDFDFEKEEALLLGRRPSTIVLVATLAPNGEFCLRQAIDNESADVSTECAAFFYRTLVKHGTEGARRCSDFYDEEGVSHD